jgi:hypothetical protein
MNYQVNLLKDPGSSGPVRLLEYLKQTVTPALAEVRTFVPCCGVPGIHLCITNCCEEVFAGESARHE